MTDQAADHTEDITRRLARRGFQVLGVNPAKALLVPLNNEPRAIDAYYRFLKKYSFRLFVRDVIRFREGMRLTDLQKYCSSDTACRYLRLLEDWGLVNRQDNGRYRLVPDGIYSFGDTFEWFIAQVLVREFCCPAAWGVRICEASAGGDYDVVASVEEHVLYIETKSSPPKHVEGAEVAAFLDRNEDLRPHFSIFVEDTRLRLKDKIAMLFQEELKRRAAGRGGVAPHVERFGRNLFHISEAIYIINSTPALITNMGICLSSFLRGRGLRFPYCLR